MSRYVVIGAGAVGATLAAELHTAGIPVVLVARGAHLAELRWSGLHYVRPDGEHVVAVPVAAGPDDVELRAGDVLVLATKAQDAEAAIAEWAWQPVKDADGGTVAAADALPIVLLQNGLDTERVALRRFATVYGAVIWSPTVYVTAGEVVSPADPAVGVIWVGRYPSGRDARLEEVAADLRAARHLVEVVDDVPRWRAGKLLQVIGNALDALYEPGPLRGRAAAALRAEARQVLRLAGESPADLRAETTLDLERFAVRPIPGRPTAGRSTWQSLARGASPESDFLNGEITLLARLHGSEAPRNAAVLARVHQAVGRRRRSVPSTTPTCCACSPTSPCSSTPTASPRSSPGRIRRCCSTSGGRSVTRTVASTTARGTCRARCTWTWTPSWPPTLRTRRRAGTRCPTSRTCRPPRAGGGSARDARSSSTTRPAGSQRHGRGGCCAGPGSPTSGCSTAASRPGPRAVARSRPAPVPTPNPVTSS